MGEGPALLLPQRPLQGRRSGLLVQALGGTWDGRTGAKGEVPSKGTAEVFEQVCDPRIPVGPSPRPRVPRERGREAKVYGG